MSRELDLPNAYFGAGNWQPYPLATWLFHDKVLLYQHDLYDSTMAIDLEVLTWNLAFGLVSSYSWDALGPATSPWLELVARLQRDFGPYYVGVALSRYRSLAPDVNESTNRDRPSWPNGPRADAALAATTSRPVASSPDTSRDLFAGGVRRLNPDSVPIGGSTTSSSATRRA